MTAQDSSPSSVADQVRVLLDRGLRVVLVTVVQSDQLVAGSKLLVPELGQNVGDLGDGDLNDAVIGEVSVFLSGRDQTRTIKVCDFASELKDLSQTLLLFERIESEPSLVIAGAGHVGASLARLAALVGYRVTLIDDRAEFVSRRMFQSSHEQINLVVAESWDEAIRVAIGNGHGVSVAIVTRGHKQDEDCLRAALAANPDYIGMIGSKRRTNIVLEKLREEGRAAAEQLKKVRAPIGLDIGAVSPEEVALAILAEIVAERRGGKGGSLSDWRRV